MRLIDADAYIEKVRHEAKAMPQKQGETFVILSEWIIEKTPSIESRCGEWISCSERLPSGDVQVLVSVCVNDALWNIILMPAQSVKEYYKRGHINAWMPLPQPYEEHKEDE